MQRWSDDDGLLMRLMTKSNVITLDSVVYLCYLYYIIVQSGKKRRKERLRLTELLMGFQDHWSFGGTWVRIHLFTHNL